MRTDFSDGQLQDLDFQVSNQALRDCVHCGFCLATCPTYLMTGDERSSPRGRIYLIKEMLEKGNQPSTETVHHLDTCLSCLSCMTTCPSNVNYQHLIDHARVEIEFRVRRRLGDRLLRRLLSFILPYPNRFRVAARMGRLARPLRSILPGRLRQMTRLLGDRQSSRQPPQKLPETGRTMGLMPGCVQQILAPSIDAATIRILERLGINVIVSHAAGCCGGLDHHMGRAAAAERHMTRHIGAWRLAAGNKDIEAVVATASGCGSMLKDYGFLLRDSDLAADAAALSARARDVSEVIQDLGYQGSAPNAGLRVAYHGACSLEHGQGIRDAPRELLRQAGFRIVEIPDNHLCCGSAGSYNILHPELANELLQNKLRNIESVAPDVIVTGNIGCLTQLRVGTNIPVLHIVELLDWAAGGPCPAGLQD